jgi:hypothetical protein
VKLVVNVVNLINGRNKAQIHKEFTTFLVEMDADYSDIPLHSDIRWVSGENVCSVCFVALRKETSVFF